MYKIKLVFIFFIFADAGIEVYSVIVHQREFVYFMFDKTSYRGILCRGRGRFFVSDLSVDVFEVSGFAVVVSAFVVCVDVAAVVTAVV